MIDGDDSSIKQDNLNATPNDIQNVGVNPDNRVYESSQNTDNAPLSDPIPQTSVPNNSDKLIDTSTGTNLDSPSKIADPAELLVQNSTDSNFTIDNSFDATNQPNQENQVLATPQPEIQLNLDTITRHRKLTIVATFFVTVLVGMGGFYVFKAVKDNNLNRNQVKESENISVQENLPQEETTKQIETPTEPTPMPAPAPVTSNKRKNSTTVPKSTNPDPVQPPAVPDVSTLEPTEAPKPTDPIQPPAVPDVSTLEPTEEPILPPPAPPE